METLFPKKFKSRDTEINDVLRLKRIQKQLDAIIEGKDAENAGYNEEKQMLELDKPNIWNIYTEGNVSTQMEVDTMQLAISVCNETGLNIDTVTTFAFYSAFDMLEKRAKNSKRNVGKNNSTV